MTTLWALETAERLGCMVQVGLAYKNSNVFFNSVCIASPGVSQCRYIHKHFLYEPDELWAQEGPSFQHFEYHVTLLLYSLGIQL